MRIQRRHDDDIRELIEWGSAGWTGPSPRAEQARWAAAGARRRGGLGRVARLAVTGPGLAAAALLAGLLAATGSPSGADRLVSHAFEPPRAVHGRPPGSPPATAPAAPAVLATATAASARPAASRPTPRPSGWPSGWDDGGDRPPPSPSGSPTPHPSPSPSRSPDE